jgi:predicted regulator of Ras-like GTPase activity (Roadblock/LC7/MglB family)
MLTQMESNPYHLEDNVHLLPVKQLIYTSFCDRGFMLLTSQNTPLSVQQSFIQKIVQTFWDPYLPPSSSYRAAYFYQMPPETPGTVFGWLYHDGYDEIGRSDIPYFIAYYLNECLQPVQLSAIFTCLEQGPIAWIDRCNPLQNVTLAPLSIESFGTIISTRQGVVVPAAIRVQSFKALQSQVLTNYFFANTSEQPSPVSPPTLHQTHSQNPQQAHRLQGQRESQEGRLVMDSKNIESILQELIYKPIQIYGAVLVSSEGQAITKPIGIDEKSSAMMAGTMIYLAKNTQAELNWQEVEQISMRAQEGYLILTRCNAEVYLLIHSGKVPIGLLEGEISQTVTKLQSALNPVADQNQNTIIQSAIKPQNYLPMEGKIEEPLDLNLDLSLDLNEVTYRGRRASS